MKNRRVLRALPLAALLALVPAASLSSDSNLSIEEARNAATELVQLVGPEHDCDIFNVALRKVSPADEEHAIYVVSYDALGLRCILANQELNETMQKIGSAVYQQQQPPQGGEAPGGEAPPPGGEAPGGDDEGTVEGEFREV